MHVGRECLHIIDDERNGETMNNPQIGVRLPWDQPSGSVPGIPSWKCRKSTFYSSKSVTLATTVSGVVSVTFQPNLQDGEIIDFFQAAMQLVGDANGETVENAYLQVNDASNVIGEWYSTPLFQPVIIGGANNYIVQNFNLRSLRFDDYSDVNNGVGLKGGQITFYAFWKNTGAGNGTVTMLASVVFNKHQIGR